METSENLQLLQRRNYSLIPKEEFIQLKQIG